MFARYCGGSGSRAAGSYEADAVQTGMTDFWAEPMGSAEGQYDGTITPRGNVSVTPSGYSDTYFIPIVDIGVMTSHKVFTINQRFADRTRPENVALPAALYMGSPAEV